jgi:hypothetical protein
MSDYMVSMCCGARVIVVPDGVSDSVWVCVKCDTTCGAPVIAAVRARAIAPLEQRIRELEAECLAAADCFKQTPDDQIDWAHDYWVVRARREGR